MKGRGWFRLWVVASAIAVPALAEWNFLDLQSTWQSLDNVTIQQCVDEEFNRPNHPDAMECGRRRGVYKSIFEREHTTAGRFWAESLGFSFVADLIVTGLLIVAFLVIRWVVRGFRNDGN